jgi:hypothetical protein
MLTDANVATLTSTDTTWMAASSSTGIHSGESKTSASPSKTSTSLSKIDTSSLAPSHTSSSYRSQSGLRIGLGLGLGVGISVLVIVLACILWYRAQRARKGATVVTYIEVVMSRIYAPAS